MSLIRVELQRRRLPRPGPLLHDLSQVLYLPFDHDDGSRVRDRSGYNNHGTIYGATRVAGKVASALSFDGVDDYVQIPHSASLDLDYFTILCWIYPYVVDPFACVICKQDAYGTTGWSLGFEMYEYLGFFFTYDGVSTTVEISPVKAKEWIHVGITFNGSITRTYINGKLYISETNEGVLDKNTEPIRIGIRGTVLDPSEWFEGIIDEVRIYNKALTEAVIKLIMNRRRL